MVTNTEEAINLDWVESVMERYNPHVERVDDRVADFRFKRAEWALCATSYGPAYIPVGPDRFIRFREPSFVGINDMSPFRLSEWDRPSTYRRGNRLHLPDSYERVFSPSPTGVGQLREAFPDFFLQEKLLVFLAGDDQSPEHVRELVEHIQENGAVPWNYVFFPVLGNGSHPVDEVFYEYMTGLHFIEQGYIATNFGARNVRGAPDLFAFRAPEIASKYGGRFALEFLFAPEAVGEPIDRYEERSFAIEAEPTSARTRSKGSSGVGQIKKQRYHRPFSGGISTGPSDRSYTEGRIGMVVFGSDAKKTVAYPEELGETDERAMYGFKEYVKFLLLESQYGDRQAAANDIAEYIDSMAQLELEELV